jgi:hypothetical protein
MTAKTGAPPMTNPRIALLKAGPFPGRVDPFAEAPRYFQQIHSSMIQAILRSYGDVLLEMDYLATSQLSRQIAEPRQTDFSDEPTSFEAQWDYPAAAHAIGVNSGQVLEMELPNIPVLEIKALGHATLVTVLEIISPFYKRDGTLLDDYRARRDRLLRDGVNVVELDLTRSIKRLLLDKVVNEYDYHIAIHLPGHYPRMIGMDYGEPLEPFALPLRGEVLAIDTQAAYDGAYRSAQVAAFIRHEGAYGADHLPFPSLLSEKQKRAARAAVDGWEAALARLAG